MLPDFVVSVKVRWGIRTVLVPDIQRFLAIRQHVRFSADYFEYLTQSYGTPYYMSPEQAQQGMVSERTDVFSLGVTLYHILTKKYPYRLVFESPVLDEGERIRPATSLNPHVPRWVDEIVLEATQLSPEHRYQSVAEMQRDFLAYTDEHRSQKARGSTFQIGEIVVGGKTQISTGDISNSSGQLYIGRFNNVMTSLQSEQKELAFTLGELKDSILRSSYLSDEKKKELIEVLSQIGEETTKSKPNKTVLKSLGDGLMASLKAIPDIAKAIAALAPLLSQYV